MTEWQTGQKQYAPRKIDTKAKDFEHTVKEVADGVNFAGEVRSKKSWIERTDRKCKTMSNHVIQDGSWIGAL